MTVIYERKASDYARKIKNRAFIQFGGTLFFAVLLGALAWESQGTNALLIALAGLGIAAIRLANSWQFYYRPLRKLPENASKRLFIDQDGTLCFQSPHSLLGESFSLRWDDILELKEIHYQRGGKTIDVHPLVFTRGREPFTLTYFGLYGRLQLNQLKATPRMIRDPDFWAQLPVLWKTIRDLRPELCSTEFAEYVDS